MKRIFSFFFLAALLVNCTAEAQKVRVEGVADAKATMAYLVDLDAPGQPVLDSVAVSNCQFTADIQPTGHLIGVMTNGGYRQVIFAEGEKVHVDVVEDIVNGTGLNDIYGKFLEQKKALAGNQKAINELLVKVCQENKTNNLPVAAISMSMGDLELQYLVQALPDDAPYAKHPLLGQISAMKAALALRQIGSPLKDIDIPDANGKLHKLSEYVGKGKYVLVDFWASWCGPCCREMPNVVEAYAKYKDKGFEIVGVSLDQKKDNWLNMVKKLGMTWPQLSDLKGWRCEAAGLYGVRAIPSNILFSPEGIIIATDLTGPALQNKLAEIFK